jgi:ubiquitin-protein ligase
VLLSTCALLGKPSKDYGLDVENAAMYRTDPDQYMRKARK